MQLSKKLVPVILFAAAVLFGYFSFRSAVEQREYMAATGTITDIQAEYNAGTEQTDYDVTVRYTVDGIPYENLLGSYDASMQVGKTVDILYDAADPNRITQKGNTATVLYSAMSAVAVAGGIYMLAQNRKQEE